LGTRKGRKLEEIMFCEPVLKKGLETLKDATYALK
jgi:hypothetical protein